MRLIEVIPISKSAGIKDTLSYFTGEDIPTGSIVSVPLRSRTIPGLVVRSVDAATEKSALKSADFAIRKADTIAHHNFLTSEFMESAEEIARYSAAPIGTILNALLPAALFSHIAEHSPTVLPYEKISTAHEQFILQASFEDRVGHYKSLIRECFAKKQSIFICVPNIEDARKLYEVLSKGIETYIVSLYNGMPQKALRESWDTALSTPHPLLIIGTGKFLCLPRRDIALIILERENAKGYKGISRPYLDIRTFAQMLAKKMKIKIVFGDMLLRVETLWKHAEGECQELIAPSYRVKERAIEEKIIDMRPYSPSKGREFQIISDELKAILEKAGEKKEKVCIFTLRRGLAPLTVCGDCGTIVHCHTCHAPTTLHTQGTGENKEFFFLCHRCGERRSAEERCAYCEGWKLVTLGIGIEGVEKALQGLFPDTELFRIDSDTTDTDKKIHAVLKRFEKASGGILLCTEMAVPYLTPVPHVAIASIDSLFSLPDFRIYERLLYTLLMLRQNAEKTFTVQTRAMDERIFEYALRSNVADFYRQEIKEREAFAYPPFTTLIKISLVGLKENVLKDMELVKETMKPYEFNIFPAFVKSVKGTFTMHGLIKVPREKWVDDQLLGKLRTLSPQYSVAVDPETLL